ncbi:XRE family transcriptional regulator [Eupransor demetentiae]|uniref:Uncharacterized protein n=1 Tax=Eupransor demetentiae TaxID=3109584 RepID=A0ABM9N4X7_9LACO|nr:hypothetical protein R54876_GBNLAHCA_00730 [Lactobacillaceae bacterium LMG 33000]
MLNLNIQKIQSLSQLSDEEVLATLKLNSPEELAQIKAGQKELSRLQLEELALKYSAALDELGKQYQQEQHPIHIRLTADYLLNLGLTSTDWITLRWALEGQWQGQKLVVAFFQEGQIKRVIQSDEDFIQNFAGYLILEQGGKMEAYRDEHNQNAIYDWRILRYRSDTDFIDITPQILATDFTKIQAQ